jgi:hypothetical protein
MKTTSKFLIILALTCFVQFNVIECVGQNKKDALTRVPASEYRILDHVPYETIKIYIGNLNARIPGIFNSWRFKNKFAIDSAYVRRLIAAPENDSLIIVLGRGSRLKLDITAFNSKKRIPKANQLNQRGKNIKARSQKLKDKLDRPYPYGLTKFPLAIKLPKDQVASLMDSTRCKYVLLFLGIEPEKNGIHKLVEESLTVCILGSEETSDAISPLHISGTVDGRETWPDASFILDGEGDIIWE